jgi:hypothetical protein
MGRTLRKLREERAELAQQLADSEATTPDSSLKASDARRTMAALAAISAELRADLAAKDDEIARVESMVLDDDETDAGQRFSTASRDVENRSVRVPGRPGDRAATPLLRPEQRMRDWVDQHPEPTAPWSRRHAGPTEDVRIGALVHALVRGRADSLNETEYRVMTEGVSTAGGAFVPTPTMASFIDRAATPCASCRRELPPSR